MSTKLYTQLLHIIGIIAVAVLTGVGTIPLSAGISALGTLLGFGLGLGTSYVTTPTTPTTNKTGA